MLECFLEQQTILATLMSKNLRRGTEVHTLSEVDISNAEDIVKVMTPIKIASTMMCEEEQPTVSVIAPLQAKLQKHLKPCKDDTEMTREMKSMMAADFSCQYKNSRDVLLKDEMHPAKKLTQYNRAMDLPFGNSVRQVPETCPLSSS
ncbi:zinc finger BED domain-containing 1-like protein [Labeo rohita]|uniref:Zinc finger BED domain-containing 1-like protein n=1 Tax=Labeo rohita TaxID=84645 RepID=A0A498NAQ5_LABRO|nr:zinc finger BED domain-containing 1-like protein [Labeo rohita]